MGRQIAQLCTREDLRRHPCRTCLSRRLTEKLPPLQFSPSACDRSWHLPHLSVSSDVTARASVTDRCARLQARSQPLGETWRGECLSASPWEEDKELLYVCSVVWRSGRTEELRDRSWGELVAHSKRLWWTVVTHHTQIEWVTTPPLHGSCRPLDVLQNPLPVVDSFYI